MVYIYCRPGNDQVLLSHVLSRDLPSTTTAPDSLRDFGMDHCELTDLVSPHRLQLLASQLLLGQRYQGALHRHQRSGICTFRVGNRTRPCLAHISFGLHTAVEAGTSSQDCSRIDVFSGHDVSFVYLRNSATECILTLAGDASLASFVSSHFSPSSPRLTRRGIMLQ